MNALFAPVRVKCIHRRRDSLIDSVRVFVEAFESSDSRVLSNQGPNGANTLHYLHRSL